MSNKMRRHEGVTLLEVLLVLAIAMSLFVLSLRLYYSYRRDADTLQLRNNIDTLFLAAANYYQANCPKGGELDPEIAVDDIKPLDITADLKTNGFLATGFPQGNPLVDDSLPSGAYTVQFNKHLIPRMQSVCSNPPACTLTTELQIGTIVIWKIQVAVLMKNTDPVRLENDKNFLLADCLTTITGNASALCVGGSTGTALAFERLPSAVISNVNAKTTYWTTNPLVKQFKQMYTTNPMSNLTTQSHEPEYQYFYCSG